MTTDGENKTKIVTGPTAAQRRAIESTSKTVIVTASAGAGKTATMIARVMDFVKEKKVPLPSIVMLTFTNTAAQEMKVRLSKELHKAIAASTDRAEQLRLGEAIDSLPLFHCSTIDSFCYKLVKTHFEILGLSPMVSLMDEDDMKSLMDRATRELSEELYASDPTEYHDLLASFSEDEENVAKAIVDVYKYAETTESGEAFLARAEEIAQGDFERSPAMEEFFRKMSESAQAAKDEILTLEPDFPTEASKFRKGYLDMIAALNGFIQARSLRDVANARGSVRFNVKTDEENFPALRVRFDRIREIYSSFVAAFKTPTRADTVEKEYAITRRINEEALRLIRLTRRFKEIYSRIKEEQLVIDFSDVEHYALELFTRYGVQKEIGCRFLLVDECQDLNPLQEALMERIVDGNNLFMVGDVKQSIFRFRLSDPLIMQNRIRRGRGAPDTDVIDFTENFRSSDEVIGFVNTVFSRLMTEDFGGEAFPLARRGGYEGGSGRVRAMFYHKPAGEEAHADGIYSVRRAASEIETSEAECEEGAWVRDRIRELIGETYTSTDPRVTDPQTFRYSDIAILSSRKMRPGNMQEKIIETLRRAEIPVNIGSFVKDRDYPEIRSIVDFLRLIESPMNDYAMLSVLRSDMFGFSLERIAEISLAEGASFYEKARRLGEEGAVDLKSFFDYLDRMRELSGILSLHELVSRLIDEKMRLPVLRRVDGRKVFGEILSFAEGLKGQDPMPSISEYLPYFDKYYRVKEGGEVAESDAVNVMSIHASKGLEFPVVFVIGLDDSIIGQLDSRDSVRLDKEYGLVKKPSEAKENVYFDRFKEKKERELTEDKLRLLYVALTRARNYLFLSGAQSEKKDNKAKEAEIDAVAVNESEKDVVVTKEKAKTLCDWIMWAIRGTNYSYYEESNPPYAGALSTSAPQELEKSEEEAAALERAEGWRYAHEKATETSIKFTVTAINDREEVELPPSEIRFPAEDRKAKGTAFHAAMEHLPFSVGDEAEASDLLDKLVTEGVFEAADRRDLSPVKVFGAIRGVRALIGDAKAYREKSFLLRLSAREAGVADIDDPVLVQGKIDLLAIHGDEAILVDYKLSGLTAAALAEKYRKQLELYEKAVRAGFPSVAKVHKYIFVLGRNEAISLD